MFLEAQTLAAVVNPRELDEERDGSYYGNIGRCLAPSARSNPTAFQAVCFQPPDPYENRENDGIQT